MLNRDTAALVVIDIQDKLMPRDEIAAAAFLARLDKLIRAAQGLDIPVLVTEQNPERLGGTTAQIAETLGSTPRIPKLEFGCTANPAFRDALKSTGRTQLLVTGMETHICVMQTVFGAMDAGYAPFVVRDAVCSMDPSEHEAGLQRMSQAGASVVTTQMAIFELLGAAGTPEFKKLLPLLK